MTIKWEATARDGGTKVLDVDGVKYYVDRRIGLSQKEMDNIYDKYPADEGAQRIDRDLEKRILIAMPGYEGQITETRDSAGQMPDIQPGPIVTPQDRGEPSPVPYSLIVQRPSPDLPQDGVSKIYFTGAYAELWELTAQLTNLVGDLRLAPFIRDTFERGVYRLEIVVGNTSIKVYKHPNNP